MSNPDRLKPKQSIMDPERNPCWKEASLSQGCIERNHYKSDQCDDEFENYRNCKKFWLYVEKQRIKTQTKPYLPPVEEREAAIKAHLQNFMEGR